MKKSRFFIGLLSLMLATMMSVTFATSSSAFLYCYQIVGCTGNAGCGFGSVSGCTMTCSDGPVVYCVPNNDPCPDCDPCPGCGDPCPRCPIDPIDR